MARKTAPKPMTPPGYVTTHDLKERGWTASLISKFLGEHDSTRPNGMRMGKKRLPPVKLYLEERALETEQQDLFLEAQAKAADAKARAEKAGKTRKTKRLQVLQAAAEEFKPSIQHREISDAVRNEAEKLNKLAKVNKKFKSLEVFKPYQKELKRVAKEAHTKLGLTAAEKVMFEGMLYQLLAKMLLKIYPWVPQPSIENKYEDVVVDQPPKAKRQTAKPSDWQTWDWEE